MKQVNPITKEAIDALFDIQAGKPISGSYIENLWKRAHKELSKDDMRHEFMVVLKQIWSLASTANIVA